MNNCTCVVCDKVDKPRLFATECGLCLECYVIELDKFIADCNHEAGKVD